MSTINFPGLLTGIDTTALIKQLMEVEKKTLILYQSRQTTWQKKQDALNTLETKLSALKSAVAALSNSNQLRSFSATTSDEDIVTAEASYNAFEGNHTVVINQLATAERWVHAAGKKYTEDYVGVGTFMYSYDNKQTTITTTATTTLEELVGLINNDADNPGVTASLLYYNDAYHLVLNGNDAGLDYRIAVDASSIEKWEANSAFTLSSDNATLSTKIVDLDQFGSEPLEGGEYIQINGTSHFGDDMNFPTVPKLYLTDNTKLSHLIAKINDAFDGLAKATLVNGKIVLTDTLTGASSLSLTLTYNANGSAATLTLPTMSVSTEGGSTTANLSGFAKANFTETQSAQDSEIKVDGYPTGQAGVKEVQVILPSSLATSGTYTLTFDGETTAALNYNASIADVQAAMEALPNLDIGDITVTGNPLSASGGLVFTFGNTLGDVPLVALDTSNLTPSTPSNYRVFESTKGKRYDWIRRSSNTIDDVIHGVTLHLHDTGTINLTLTRDIESIKTKISKMVSAYNDVISNIKENTKYDTTSKKAGVLMGDSVVSYISTLLNTPLVTQTNGFVEDIDTFLTPGHLGFQLGSDGLLTFDTNVFDKAIAKDYKGVLAVIGADKTGSSSSNTIKFYSASSNYTTAGSYDVQVTVSGGAITSAKIKLSTESTYRDATFSGNIVTGDSSFDDNGDPVYPENGLQLSVNLSQDGILSATIKVKQGFAGALEDALTKMLATTTGSIQIGQQQASDMLKNISDKIDSENTRLSRREARLVARFARLEKTLALIQRQMSALGLSTS